MTESLLALYERLRKHSRNITRQTDARNPLAADLRYAAVAHGGSEPRPIASAKSVSLEDLPLNRHFLA